MDIALRSCELAMFERQHHKSVLRLKTSKQATINPTSPQALKENEVSIPSLSNISSTVSQFFTYPAATDQQYS